MEALLAPLWDHFGLKMVSRDPSWEPKWVPKGMLETREDPRDTLDPPERAKGDPRDHNDAQMGCQGELGTSQGEPKRPQGRPKGAQRTPKGPPKGTFLHSFAAPGPFWKSSFSIGQERVSGSWGRLGEPKWTQKRAQRTPREEQKRKLIQQQSKKE